MKVIEIAFVCFPVTNLQRSRNFYENTLNLKATKTWVKDDLNGFVEYDIGSSTLAIGAGSDSFKIGEGGASIALEVDEFDTAIKHLKSMKTKFLSEPGETPVCQMAIILDHDGNKIMIHKRKN
jgi:predicted enzyme related to lactoylglutathione lyase